MKRIETHRTRVPWSWVGGMTGPWLALFYIDNVSDNGPLTFTIRRFVENPMLIALLSSINVAFSFTVGAVASYMSDRIWTPWGRRRPFLIAGWTGAAVMMMCLPFAQHLAVLVVFIVLLQLCADVAKPMEALYNEVVPPGQRGRAGTMRNIGQQLLGLLFFGVLVVQFDRIHELNVFGHTLRISGETVLYWSGALLVLAVVAFLVFAVRETPPAGSVVTERFDARGMFRDVFGHRQWWLVYLLYVTPILAGPSGGSFGVLMQTEQLGFSKAQLGFAVSVGLIVTVTLFAPLAGYLADHTSRMRLLRVGLVGPALVEFALFLYLRYVVHYSTSLGVFMAFGLVAVALKTCAYLVWGALVFDYIPSNRFGTVSAGLTVVGGITPFLTINLSGVWVTEFTRWFGAPGASAYDYSSLYVLQIGCAALALWLTYYFEREERHGRVVPLGRRELVGDRIVRPNTQT